GSPFSPSADGTLAEPGRIVGDYSGWGAYVNLDFAVTDTLDLSLGLRYTDDEKDFAINVPTPTSELGAYWAYGFTTAGFVKDTQSWDDLTPRVIVKWHPTDERMFFASYTAGFKSGGFGSFALNDPNGAPAGFQDPQNVDATNAAGFRPNAFGEETIDSIELGYKDTLFDGRTNVELTAFFYNYEDLQVVINTVTGAGQVGNVGDVEAQGLEGSVTTALGDNFTLYLAVGWLDSEATELQTICGLEDVNGCEGTSLFWAPDVSGAVVLNGDFPIEGGEIRSSLEAFWESERGGGWESLPETEIDSYVEMALRVGYHSDDNWHVDAYVENLTDEFTWDGQNNNSGIIPSHFFGPKRPRTFGLRFGFSWE
ncbi:MAG: TonB-dependent receptor domain-containing protein, partial [Pseudomonadales bacterium]